MKTAEALWCIFIYDRAFIYNSDFCISAIPPQHHEASTMSGKRPATLLVPWVFVQGRTEPRERRGSRITGKLHGQV